MSTVDRNQFKGATLASIKDEETRAAAALPVSNDFSNRPGFHTIVEGRNFRRIAPAHHIGEPAYRAKSTVSLECEVPEYDGEGNPTGKKEVKKKNIFIATQHSTILTEDPIVMYIDAVKKLADDKFKDQKDRASFLAPVNGWRGKDGKWNWGIKPTIDYVCYCWDEKGVLGREQLYPGMLDDMKKVSIARNDDNKEIVPDIFTKLDDGYPLIITKQKKEKGGFEYIISCDMPSESKRETWDQFFDRHRVTDEQLIDFMEKESLADLYKNVYTMRDFNMAVDGLQRFDKANKYGIFDNDQDFLDDLAALKSKVPAWEAKDGEANATPAPETAPAARPTPKVETKVEQPKGMAPNTSFDKPAGTSADAVPPLAMKRALRAYIAENYPEKSLPELDAQTLVNWYNLTLIDEELPFESLEGGSQDEAPDTAPEPEKVAETPKQEVKNVVETPKSTVETVTAPTTGIDPELQKQIDMLRNRRGANKS